MGTRKKVNAAIARTAHATSRGFQVSRVLKKRVMLKDRLGQLTLAGACRLLDIQPESLWEAVRDLEVDPNHVKLVGDVFTCRINDSELQAKHAKTTITEMASKRGAIAFNCDHCGPKCVHIAAMLHFILENKLLLGLSTVPDPKEPIENLTETELVARAIAERQERADNERMQVESKERNKVWTDYVVISHESGKSYRVALRGEKLGESYCSCPDFRVNHLGTCKHILHVLKKVRNRFSKKELETPYQRKNLSLRVDYTGEIALRFNLPTKPAPEVLKLIGRFAEMPMTDAKQIVRLACQLEAIGHPVHIYPDANEWIEKKLLQDSLKKKTEEIRKDPKNHPLRKSLLKAELLPYQLDGIAFAVGAGRAILADEMGLGKTIQGIGVAELLSKFANVKNVLVVCPASLKSQWKSEVQRFSDRTAEIIMGSAEDRARQYSGPMFFKIANYEQIVRDEKTVAPIHWDLIILDEGQRIKNWETQTSRTFKQLKSTFALVLSGTPLENRLEELYNVVSFIDSRRLGPAYRFINRHRFLNQKTGKLEGYKNLDEVREHLKPVLLRRTRDSVKLQLPERTTDIVRITPTAEQRDLSQNHMALAARIAAKPYLTEIDMLNLRRHLLFARLAANSTFLIDKTAPAFSSKLETLDELLSEMADEATRKVVIFSEWTTMLDLIEPLLEKNGMPFVRLDGEVAQKKRAQIVNQFQNDPDCRAILLSNAGATGLNLQAANTVINVNLPWNPAILEQRIARAHRMGQKNPVQVFLLVTEDTLEERLLSTLAAKQDLALAALDVTSDVETVFLTAGMDDLKKKLERLLGKPAPAAIDDSMLAETVRDVVDPNPDAVPLREKVANAGGELLGAALNLVATLINKGSSPDREQVDAIEAGLNDCVERDANGRAKLVLTLPDENTLRGLAETLAKLLVK